MKDTYFFLPVDRKSRLVTVYMSDSTNHAVRAPEGSRGQGHYVDGPRKSFSGGAGLLSTSHDYARFLQMLLQGGQMDGKRYLSPRMVDVMTSNQVGTLYGTAGQGWGLAFATVERLGADGMASVGSYSWGGAYASTYRVDPAERLVFVFMINQIPSRTDLPAKFSTLLYQALTDVRSHAVQR
jgi:CubicO group peptidase (beta-lactamase class C family)